MGRVVDLAQLLAGSRACSAGWSTAGCAPAAPGSGAGRRPRPAGGWRSVWRSVCGLTRRTMPAARAERRTIVCTLRTVSRPPRAFVNSGAGAPPARPSQASSACAALAPTGTIRSLRPLPRTRTVRSAASSVVDVEARSSSADPHPGGVEQLEDRPSRTREAPARRARRRARRPRRSAGTTAACRGCRGPRTCARGIRLEDAPADEEAEAAPQRGQLAGDRGRRSPALCSARQVRTDRARVGRGQTAPVAVGQEALELVEVGCGSCGGCGRRRLARPRDDAGTRPTARSSDRSRRPSASSCRVAAALAHAAPRALPPRAHPLGQERRGALGARLGHRALPHHEVAVGVVRAARRRSCPCASAAPPAGPRQPAAGTRCPRVTGLVVLHSG